MTFRPFFVGVRRHWLRSVPFACALLLPLMAAASARADDPKAEESTYDMLVKKGIAEYDRGNWLEAKVYFGRAHALHPNARTLRSLGMTAYELRSYVEASKYFREALASTQRPLTDSMRVQVEDTLRQAQSFIGTVRLTLEPANAELLVDGQAPERDAQGRLLLDAGEHELTASADGCDDETRKLNAQAGSNPDETWTLPQLPESIALPTPPAPKKPAEAPGFFGGLDTQQKVALGIGAGGVVTWIVAGSLTAVMLAKNGASNDGHCDGNACDARGVELRDSARDFGDAATVTAIAGAVLVSAALATYFSAPAGHEHAAAIALAPYAAVRGGGIALGGSL
jgi:hypothetical protein